MGIGNYNKIYIITCGFSFPARFSRWEQFFGIVGMLGIPACSFLVLSSVLHVKGAPWVVLLFLYQ